MNDPVNLTHLVGDEYEDLECMYRIIIFTNPGCTPCAKLSPIMQEVIKELNLNVTKIDVTTETGIQHAAKYNVIVYPTIFLLKKNVIERVLNNLVFSRTDANVIKKRLIEMFQDYTN
jgi:thiol-disulfide isomerase/thioredoxin